MSFLLFLCVRGCLCDIFFFNDPATSEIYTLSLHDALPISGALGSGPTSPLNSRNKPTPTRVPNVAMNRYVGVGLFQDRKSTRLNSSHQIISYAVFCLKKKKTQRKMAEKINLSLDHITHTAE